MKIPEREEDPVAQRVQPREGHVPRADHQRQQVVPERSRRHRDDEEEDHRHPVHREKLVVGGRADDVLVRLDQLRADDQRLGAAGREEHERRPEVEKADPLVVGRHHPAEHAGPRLPHALEAGLLVDGGAVASLEALQVGDEGVELRAGEVEVRHLVPRLEVLGVDDPAREVAPACSGSSRRRASCGSRGASGRGRRSRARSCRGSRGSSSTGR